MENNIAVGTIIGLVTASSFYIYNSNKINSTQKTVLMICILFPPVQWLGILIVLAYNNYIENNSFEKITERKIEQKTNTLNSQVESLKDLKEKGILTEEEYSQKISRIEQEKKEENLKNSQEYKQLKSLFDSGVLTKEEFDTKHQLLQNVPQKELPTEIINETIDSLKDKYSEATEEKNKSFTTFYVLILFFILLISGIIFFSNSNSNNTQDVYLPQTIDTSTTYNTTNEKSFTKPLKIKKYAYIRIKTEIPEIYNGENYKFSSKEKYTKEESAVYFCSFYFKDTIFTSDVIEIEDYNENSEKMFLADYQKIVREKLNKIDYNVREVKLIECKNPDDLIVIKKKKIESKITNKQIYKFDSYSEANTSKKMMNKKE